MSDKQREIFFLIIAVTCLLALLTAFMALTVIVYNKRKRKIILENEIIKKNFEQELLRTQLEIQEQTLKTISEEIHDNIGQVLSLAKLKLNTLDFAKAEALREKTTDAKSLVSKAIQDLRDLSRSLNTDTIASLGLVRALEQELELFQKSGYTTSLQVDGSIRKLEPQRELIIFRIIQESLNNIIKHAEAKTIRVNASYQETGLQLSVEDDGKGAPVSALDMEKNSYRSLGLRNMHNRATMIGAVFTLLSEQERGTKVTLDIPFN